MADDKITIATSDDPRIPDKSNEIPAESITPEQEHVARMSQIRDRHQILETAWSRNRDAAIEDDTFVAGDQWEDIVRQDREEDDRPMHTYNLLLSFCNQIVNQIRDNTPQIRVKPVDGDAGPLQRVDNMQGTMDYSMSDVFMGIIRNIEHVSKADQAYDTACEHQVQHGFGFFRVVNRYTRNDSFDQELVIKRIKNSYSVLPDMACEEADWSDMKDCFVFTNISKTAFERLYPDAKYTSFQNAEHGTNYQGWYDREALRLAEYYWIDYVQDEVVQLSNGMVTWRSTVEQVLDELEQDEGIFEVRARKVKKPVCMWQKMTADDILEGPFELPFSSIPVCAVLGKELIKDGDVEYHSAIRQAKDAQRAFNYWQTAATETVALAPRAPWIVTSDAIEGWEKDWEDANRRNLPYLTYNFVEGQPAPQRVFPAQQAAAELQQAAVQQQIMRDIVGLHEANLGTDRRDQSGKAINALNARGDLATFIFPDNLARAIQYMGRLLVEAIPQIYDTQRVLRIRMPDDSEDFVEINKAVTDEDTNQTVYLHDLNYGRYDVVIDTGPSFQTQRQESQEMILEAMSKLPPDKASMVAHLLIKSMDFPGSEDVYELLRRMLPDNLKTDEERQKDLPKGVTLNEMGEPIVEDTGEPYQPPPTPEQQLAMAEAEAEKLKHEATIAKSEGDKAMAEAKVKEAEAKIQQIQLEMQQGGESGELPAEVMEKQRMEIMDEVAKIVQQAVDAYAKDHESDDEAHAAEIDEKVADGMVDALKRVRAKYGDAPGGNSPAPRATPAGNGGAAPKSAPINVTVNNPKPNKLTVQTDANGNLQSVTPEYSDDG